MDGETPSKIDLLHSESRVFFSFYDCSLDKKYSFYGLTREEATHLMRRLRHLEKMEWRQLSGLSREEGLTPEISGSVSHEMIHAQNSSEKKLVEQYYFHIRVNGKFRIFGYQIDQFFRITHIDPEGKIHGHH